MSPTSSSLIAPESVRGSGLSGACWTAIRRLMKCSHGHQLFFLGACVGWLAWRAEDGIAQLAWIVMLPIAWRAAQSRWAAAALMAGYYFAGARGLIVGAGVFFGDGGGFGRGLFLWGAACLLLTAPYLLIWSADARKKPWAFLCAMAVSMVPPLAIIGWLHPLAIAGVFFPGLGWIGLGLTVCLLTVLAAGYLRGILAFCTMAFACNSMAVFTDPKPAPAWVGVDTNFSALSSGGAGDAGRLLATMERVQWIKQFAATIPAGQVWVLPETVAGVFDILSEYDLAKTEADLRARRARLIVGAEVPQADGRYKNVLIVLGSADAQEAHDTRFLNLFGRENVGTVAGLRVAASICYEQLLAYSWLWTMQEKPDVLIAVNNLWWARNTSLPNIMLQNTISFGRLFYVRVVVSRNG